MPLTRNFLQSCFLRRFGASPTLSRGGNGEAR